MEYENTYTFGIHAPSRVVSLCPPTLACGAVQVYKYLRRVRRAEGAASTSEADIQATLQELAGKHKYHDCFLVDQLVFLQA